MMATAFNRRAWLKASIGIASGAAITPSLVSTMMAAPVSEAERNVFAKYKSAPIRIRLNSNENPYGPSEKARKAVTENLVEGNRYTFQVINEIKELIARYEGVSPGHVAIGAGSGELLAASGIAFGIEGGSLLSAYPTFPMLMTYGEIFSARWDKVNLNDKLEHDYDAMAARVKDDTKLVFICNPNNPTGTLVDPEVVKSFVKDVSRKVPVYCDEAYLEFLEPSQQKSMVTLVKEGHNVIVSRTFSKIYGLAGLRIGYLVGKPTLISRVSKYLLGISMNQAAIAAAKASLGDTAFMELSRTKNAQARKHLTHYLDNRGIFYGKSHTNFVFLDPKSDPQLLMAKMAEQGIAIRTWDYNGKLWSRVSVGTLDEMKMFTKAWDAMAL
jgi:histidinol-phosphate aminotransferase